MSFPLPSTELHGRELEDAWLRLHNRGYSDERNSGSIPSPWHGQCVFYLSGVECNVKTCTGRHDLKDDRPTCRRFAQNNSCPKTAQTCWLPHRLDKHLYSCSVILQASWSHAERLDKYIQEAYGARVASSVRRRAHGLSKQQDGVILLDVPSADDRDHIYNDLKEDPVVGIALRSAYSVDFASQKDDFSECLAFFEQRLRAHGGDEITCRIHGYPLAEEAAMLAALDPLQGSDDDIAAGRPGRDAQGELLPFRLRLSRKAGGYDLLLTSVLVDGVHYCAVVAPGSPLFAFGHCGSKGRDEELAICRAYFKLREVGRRTGMLAPLPPRIEGEPERVAMDVGAAPGGWSSYLASFAGYDRVLAVDPGALEMHRLPAAVEHMPIKAEHAVPALLARGVQLSAYVCDMNCPVPVTVDVFLSALPLLAPGAAVCLTLKNFDGSLSVWRRNCEAAAARVAEACGVPLQGVRTVHLLANGPVEVTLLATYRPTGPA